MRGVDVIEDTDATGDLEPQILDPRMRSGGGYPWENGLGPRRNGDGLYQ
jgi:hypothetical protein